MWKRLVVQINHDIVKETNKSAFVNHGITEAVKTLFGITNKSKKANMRCRK